MRNQRRASGSTGEGTSGLHGYDGQELELAAGTKVDGGANDLNAWSMVEVR